MKIQTAWEKKGGCWGAALWMMTLGGTPLLYEWCDHQHRSIDAATKCANRELRRRWRGRRTWHTEHVRVFDAGRAEQAQKREAMVLRRVK